MKRPVIALVLAATACGSTSGAAGHGDAGTGTPACPAQPVDLEADAGAFADCGSVVPGTGCLGGQPPPSVTDLAALACLEDALAACTPARLDYAQPAATTGPRQTFLVEPAGGGSCRLVVLTDDQVVPDRSVTREVCTGVTIDRHCLGVWGASCDKPTTLCSGS